MEFNNQNTVSSSMEQVNPLLLVSDGFELQDQNIIPSMDTSASFSPEVNNVEFYVYDENYNILTSNYNFTKWGINDDANTDEDSLTSTNQLTINPISNVVDAGYEYGSLYALYNFINLELNSAYDKLYYISEISSDRTEIRLKSNFISNEEIEQSYYPFKDTLDNADFFDEFYITFGKNQYQIAVNCDLDTSDEQYSILIKLYDELPSPYLLKDEVYITTKVGETQAFKVSFLTSPISNDDIDYIKGPNTNLKLNNFINNSTDLLSKNDLITSPSTASEFSLQNVLNRKGVTIQPDYSYENFGEFVNFSSAYERVKNFTIKLNQILDYQSDVATLSSTNGSTLSFPASALGSSVAGNIIITVKPTNLVPSTGGFTIVTGMLTNSLNSNISDGVNGVYNIVPASIGAGSGVVLSITVSAASITDVTATTAGSGYAVTTPAQTQISQSIQSLDNKVGNMIKNFDGYEYFLYYNTSSISYPKIGVGVVNYSYPYDLYATNSVQAQTYLGSLDNTNAYYGGVYLSASFFDEGNPNYLYYTIPEFIRDNNQNQNYLDFVNMTGQHFDELWLYTKAISERYNTTNVLDSGIPLQLADDAIAGLGYDGFGNNYNNQDNFIGLTGEDNGSYVPPTGSELIKNYIAINKGTIENYWQLDYSWEDYVEQLISPGWPYAIDRVSKEIFKRLYHNMSYLVKKKGTTAGLRQLINIWGIPSTILRISEYGGKNKDNSNDWDLWYKRYSYAYKPVGVNGNVASSSAVIPWQKLQSNKIDYTNAPTVYGIPEAIQFRFKTTGYPSSSFAGEFYSQSLITKISDAGNLVTGGTLNAPFSGPADFAVILNYTGSTSGSNGGATPYLGLTSSDYYNWGELTLHISASAGNGTIQSTTPLYLPFFNNDWWSVLLQRTYYNTATLNSNPADDYNYSTATFIMSNTTSYGAPTPDIGTSIKLVDRSGLEGYILASLTGVNGSLKSGTTNQFIWRTDVVGSKILRDKFTIAVQALIDSGWGGVTEGAPNAQVQEGGTGGSINDNRFSIIFSNIYVKDPLGDTPITVANTQTLDNFQAGSNVTKFVGGAGQTVQASAKWYYTLAAANKITDGFDGNTIGFSQSEQLITAGSNVGIQESWNKGWDTSGSADGIYFGGTQKGTKLGGGGAGFPIIYTDEGKIFSGSLQEFRYYRFPFEGQLVNTVDYDRFYDFVMNPESIEGQEISGSSSSFGMLNFRAPFGNELESVFTSSAGYALGYVENMTSVHPAVSPGAAFLATASFNSGSSPTATNNTSSLYSIIYYPAPSKRTYSNTNVETYMLDQPAMGISNRITNKIQIDDGEVYGNTLSSNISIQQDYQISRSYTEDINRVEIAFSPQDEVNDDIIATYGFGVVSDTIADPRNLYTGLDTPNFYPKLRRTAEHYFEKYKNGRPEDYLRLIKYFDFSLFSAIKNYVPARSSVNTGIVIKPHLLERNRVPLATIDDKQLIAKNPITGSTPHGVVTPGQGFNSPIVYKNIVISQSIPNEAFGLNPNPLNTNPVPRVILPQIVNITGSTGGSLNTLNEVPFFLEYKSQYPVTSFSSNLKAIAFTNSTYTSIQNSQWSVEDEFFTNNSTTGIGSVELLKNPFSSSVKARIQVDLKWDAINVAEFQLRFSSSKDNFSVAGSPASTFQDIAFVPLDSKNSPPGVFANQLTSSYITSEPVEIGNITNFVIFGRFPGVVIPGLDLQPDIKIHQYGYANRSDSDFAQAYPLTQSTTLGDVKSIAITSHEFYDGEFSGSQFAATTQSLLDNPFLNPGGILMSYDSWFYTSSYNNYTAFDTGENTGNNNSTPVQNPTMPNDGEIYLYANGNAGDNTVKFGGGGASSI